MTELGAQPRLVVPEGLLVDEIVRERLARQLDSAPIEVAGVAAEVADLAPGASYRVHVEWAALESQWSAAAPGSTATSKVRGAVLLRGDTGFAVRDGAVEVTAGGVLVDPGAFAHDPARAIGPLEAATDRGRPPFPRRPVVVFLGCEPGGEGDWVRRLANRLVRTNVEARIAMPDVAPGVHLTRPCLPTEESIRALAPDVVVTLDALAAARVDAWCAGDRSTIVVAFDPALSEPMELVSWQIGRAAGRLRARIGPWVDVVAFASLVGRLCAGPHAIAPTESPQLLDIRTPVREHWTSDEPVDGAWPVPTAGCVVITGAIESSGSARVAGLADNLEAAGVRVDTVGDVHAPAARRAAIVVLAGVAASAELDALIADRRGAGLATVVDLGRADVELDTRDGSGPALRINEPVAAIVDACGLVLSPAGVLRAAASASGQRTLMMPTLLTRARAAALRDARTPRAEPGSPLAIGWRIRGADGQACAYEAAVAEGIALTLEDRRNRVEIVGDAADVPAVLHGHERVAVTPDNGVDPETLASWAVHVWTPELIGDTVVDDARLIEEASCAGVASVMPAAACSGIDGYVSPFVCVDTVANAEEWANSLHHVLDDSGVREKRAAEAKRRSDALDSAAASKAAVSRFVGWARYALHRTGAT